MYDLHIHTSHSTDGQYSPAQILRMAQECRLKGLAFTDHMDITAAAEGVSLSNSIPLTFFTGVEISTGLYGQEYHLLIYGFRLDDKILKGFLENHCHAIWDKAFDILDFFSGMGFDIWKEDIKGWGRSVPTGVTFLDALMKRNHDDERLQKYLTGPKAASPYLNFYQDYSLTDIGTIVRSSLPDLIETMRFLQGSGMFILAHPGDADTAFLKRLKDEGLVGIEAYSTHHSSQVMKRLVHTAKSLNLLISAGSDFHGERIKPDIRLGDMSGEPDNELITILKGMALR